MEIAGSYSSGQLDILQPRMSERGKEGKEWIEEWVSGQQEKRNMGTLKRSK